MRDLLCTCLNASARPGVDWIVVVSLSLGRSVSLQHTQNHSTVRNVIDMRPVPLRDPLARCKYRVGCLPYGILADVIILRRTIVVWTVRRRVLVHA